MVTCGCCAPPQAELRHRLSQQAEKIKADEARHAYAIRDAERRHTQEREARTITKRKGGPWFRI